jgi:hypothetical protein
MNVDMCLVGQKGQQFCIGEGKMEAVGTHCINCHVIVKCFNEDFIDVFPSGFSDVPHPSRVTSGMLEGSVEDARDPNQYLL